MQKNSLMICILILSNIIIEPYIIENYKSHIYEILDILNDTIVK